MADTHQDSRIRQTHQDIGIRQKYTKTVEYDAHTSAGQQNKTDTIVYIHTKQQELISTLLLSYHVISQLQPSSDDKEVVLELKGDTMVIES